MSTYDMCRRSRRRKVSSLKRWPTLKNEGLRRLFMVAEGLELGASPTSWILIAGSQATLGLMHLFSFSVSLGTSPSPLSQSSRESQSLPRGLCLLELPWLSNALPTSSRPPGALLWARSPPPTSSSTSSIAGCSCKELVSSKIVGVNSFSGSRGRRQTTEVVARDRLLTNLRLFESTRDFRTSLLFLVTPSSEDTLCWLLISYRNVDFPFPF